MFRTFRNAFFITTVAAAVQFVPGVATADTPERLAAAVETLNSLSKAPDSEIPADLLKKPSAFPWGSAGFHWSRLNHSFGGWYPVAGQLERCADGYFRLVHEEDGTEDYHRTSEEWLRGVRRKLRSVAALRVAWASVPAFVRRPAHTGRMLRCMLGSESWNWQFRGNPPPTALLRQTWERVG